MSLAFFNRRASAALVAGVALLASCNRAPSVVPSVQRIAIFPIENLAVSPNGAGAAKALALLLELQLSGLKDMAPMLVGTSSDATGQHTTRELRAYVETSGNELALRVHDRDALGKTERVITSHSTSLAQLSQGIASQVSSKARPLPVASDDALNAFAAGLGSPNTPEGVAQLVRATELAPGFGPGWLHLGSVLWDGGRRDQAMQAWQTALARGTNLDEISRARIRAQVDSLTQSPDLPTALIELGRLLPAEAEAQYRAGEMLTDARRFPEAIRAMQAAVAADPGRGPYRNALAYTQALAGDINGALATINAYEQVEPKNPNPIDSKGEILFLARRFKEAGQAFESAYGADPNFSQGFTMRKAAESYLLAGDTAKGQAVMTRWAAAVPAGGGLRERLQAVWDHRTGKRQEAINRLLPISLTDQNALAQTVVWLVQEGDRTHAAELAAKVPGASGQLLRFISMPSAEAGVWGQRAGAAFPDPRQALVRRISTIYALALDKHWSDVAAFLDNEAARLSPTRSSQMLALYRRALTEMKRTDDLKKLPDYPMLPTQGADGLFDCVVYVQSHDR